MMNQITVKASFDRSIYNSLLPVEDANKEVRKDGYLDDFLGNAEKLVRAHGMQSRLGIALLHKHNPCSYGEHMIEYEEAFDGADALVTRPVQMTPTQERAVPTVWSLHGDTYCPLEYTTDKLAAALYHDGDLPSSFLSEFASLTKASPAGAMLGVAVVRRGFYDRAEPNEGAVEYSGLIERSNVVFLRDRAEFGNRVIETAWGFADGGGRVCHMQCTILATGAHSGHSSHLP